MKLREFFVDEIISIPFKLFGKTHVGLLLFLIILCLFIYFNRNKIVLIDEKIKRRITVFIALLLLFNMITLYISSFYYQCFDFNTMLPLHLCYLSNYFYIFVILFQKKKLYPYIYFLAFLGPIPAIIFFDVPSVWEAFNFYLYVISHHILVIGGFLTFYMYPTSIKKKQFIILILVLNLLYFIMSWFNSAFNTNYFFSKSIPSFIYDVIPFIKYLPLLLVLEVCEIGIASILYLYFNRQYQKLMGYLRS